MKKITRLPSAVWDKLKNLIRSFDFFGFGDDDESPKRGNNQNRGNDNGAGGSQPRQNLLMLLIAAMVTLLIVSYFMRGASSQTTQITYSEFITMVEKDEVARVEIDGDKINIATKQKGLADEEARFRYYTGLAEDETALTTRMLEHDIIISSSVPDSSGLVISFILTYILPILLMWVLLSFLFRRMGRSGGIMGVGRSTAKEYVQRETGVTFKDVAGEDEAKESLVEVVDFLHNPDHYSAIGAKLPKGALLVGPPGTGKTLLAKAVAGEAHVPFFSLTGSDFIELYVGVGASRVRDLFREATKNAPCIIFIDEIDAIGRSRDSKYGGGNEEREQTLNQLLSEMDGFDTTKGILVLGATNRPEILDKALLRPGRFDRRIIVERPDLKGREAILKVHAKDVRMDETVDLKEIALATSGAVGSDLANMINEAAINAVKNKREYVSQKDLFVAVEEVLVGKEKKDRIMSKEERRIVSYHEVGHALIAAIQKNSEPVQKITIVPRTMGALGYVMQVPEEEKYLNTKEELHDMIVGLLGGRAAEELKFGNVTTGASNDIERATAIARSMVTQYGMSERFGLMGLATVESQYLEGRTVLNCADVTAAAVDEEVRGIIETCYQEAKRLLADNLEVMDKIAAYLIKEETITGRQFMKIYREAKGLPDEDTAKTAEEEVIQEYIPDEQASEPASKEPQDAGDTQAAQAAEDVQADVSAPETGDAQSAEAAQETAPAAEPEAEAAPAAEAEAEIAEEPVAEPDTESAVEATAEPASAPEPEAVSDPVAAPEAKEAPAHEEDRAPRAGIRGRYSNVPMDDLT